MLEKGPAPEVDLRTLDGAEFSLYGELQRSPILLVFFKISCPTCQFTLPFFSRLRNAQLSNAPCIFGISQDGPKATAEFLKHFGLKFPILLDSAADNYPASNAYAISYVPSIFLVDQRRQIAQAWTGFSKVDMEKLGTRFGCSPFQATERVPAMRPG